MDFDAVKHKIELRQGDITEMEVDAIVNSANTDLILGSGVAGAIGRKGGPEIQEECDRIRTVALGEAVATTAGALKAKYIIHAASMEVGHFGTERNIARATRNALLRSEELKLQTLALPAIGTGAGGFPAERCARVMLSVVAHHLARPTSLERVYFVLLDAAALEAFRHAYDNPVTTRPPQPSRPPRRRPRPG